MDLLEAEQAKDDSKKEHKTKTLQEIFDDYKKALQEKTLKSLKTPLLRYRTSSEGCLILAQQTCRGEDSKPVTTPGMCGGGGGHLGEGGLVVGGGAEAQVDIQGEGEDSQSM